LIIILLLRWIIDSGFSRQIIGIVHQSVWSCRWWTGWCSLCIIALLDGL